MQPSIAQVDAELTAPGQFFEIETVDVRGVPTRTWKHAPRTLRDVLAAARRNGDRPYLVLGEARISHEEHAQRVVALAHHLVDDLGVRKGDRVAIAMRNHLEWSYAFWAAACVGAIATPLNAFWNGPEMTFGILDSGAKVLIADGERLERLAGEMDQLAAVTIVGCHLDDRKTDTPLPGRLLDLAPMLEPVPGADDLPDVDLDADDDCTIFYTSGTTGHPKGVLGTHRNICSNLVAMMYVGARGMKRAAAPPAASPAPPITIMPVPFFHATGCHAMLVGNAFFGGTLVLMRRWNTEEALDLIERERATAVSGVPAMIWDLVHAASLPRRDLSSLLSVGGGGAAAPPELVNRIQEVLPGRSMGTGYGMTETSSTVASIGGPDYVARPASVGVPIPVCEVRLVDDHGNDVPAGERGEILMKGPNVVPGYWKRPEETAATFTDGWVRSGDVGQFDADGFLYIVDRAKDLIIRGGENVSSAEVEAAVYEHRSVAEAAAIPVPHPSLGEEVGVVVCVRPGMTLDADALRAHCAARLAAFKVPAHVFVLDEPLPRNPAGKVLKRALRDRFAPTG